MWARVVDGQIVAASMDPIVEAGWVEVASAARPADSLSGTWVPTVALVEGVPTRTWQARPWADGELTDAARGRLELAANAGVLRAAAQAALIANRTYLAIDSPSAPAVVVQVRALTVQMQALIRLGLDELDATN